MNLLPARPPPFVFAPRPTMELLDHPRLVQQLFGLERKTARSGRDDHGPGQHEDIVNAFAGAAQCITELGVSGDWNLARRLSAEFAQALDELLSLLAVVTSRPSTA
jgi:hypothetical protein